MTAGIKFRLLRLERRVEGGNGTIITNDTALHEITY